MKININKEKHPTKVGAIFNSEDKAQTAFSALHKSGDFIKSEIKLIPPYDSGYDKKLEPEDKKLGQTLLKSHLILALVGIVVGIFIASLLLLSGPIFLQEYIVATYLSISMLCAFIGLLIAGVISIRPDHDHLINKVRKASQKGQWAVIAHTNSRDKMEKAKEIMRPFAISLSATL